MLTAVNLMLFSLLHNPCATTIITIYKETLSAKWATIGALMPLALAFIVVLPHRHRVAAVVFGVTGCDHLNVFQLRRPASAEECAPVSLDRRVQTPEPSDDTFAGCSRPSPIATT